MANSGRFHSIQDEYDGQDKGKGGRLKDPGQLLVDGFVGRYLAVAVYPYALPPQHGYAHRPENTGIDHESQHGQGQCLAPEKSQRHRNTDKNGIAECKGDLENRTAAFPYFKNPD